MEICSNEVEIKKRNPVRYWLGKKRTLETKQKISLSRMGKNKGINNPNYKNGKYTAENIARYKHYTNSFIYKQWRESVFKRDEYRCQKCGQIGGYLTVHHVSSWAEYPQFRYLINNGLTLCEECHKKTDNYKGRGHIKI